jgi:hypothetical protein
MPRQKLLTRGRSGRTLAIATFVISSSLALGATPADEAAVRATYKQLEQALRTGDGAGWLRLMDAATLAAMPDDAKAMWRSGRFRDASIRYDAINVRVDGDEAAIVGKITSSQGGAHAQYHELMLVRERGAWKLANEEYRDQPIDPSAVYAMLPGQGGSFVAARAPWRAVSPVPVAAKTSSSSGTWTVRATRDEDSVYVRCETSKTLPSAGMELRRSGRGGASAGVPSVPLLKVKVTTAIGPKEYELNIGAVVQTRATPDAATRASHDRYFVQYSLSVDALTSNDVVNLFDNHTGDRFAKLISVDGSSITARLPLRALGVDAPGRVTIEDANRPGTFLLATIDLFSGLVR